MARLFDEILNSTVMDKDLLKSFSGAICIESSNVSDYYYESNQQEEWALNKDIPNIAPPFKIFFIEYKAPSVINSSGKPTSVDNRIKGQKQGVLFTSQLCEELPSDTQKMFPKNSNWIVSATLIWSAYNQIILMANWVYGVTQEGLWATSNANDFSYFFTPHTPSMKNKSPEEADILKGLLHPALLAISFIHCRKQTKLIEHEAPPKVQKKRERNSRPPLTKYYTLDIEPLKEILKTEGRIHEVGLQRALHICRGHFKDYSQGKGLFGKYKGLYWWDAIARGTERNGTIIKDYNVKI